MTDEGQRQLANFGEVVAKVRGTVTMFGGALEHVWQTAGIYDFVAVLSFPSLEAEFQLRDEVYKLGVLRADHIPAMPIEDAVKLLEG